jgi:superfamily II DNA or RNA helicase
MPKYVIALSATLERSDGLESMIYSIAGTHKIERLSENPFKMFRLRTGIKLEEEKGSNGMLNYSKFVNDQAECIERNLMAINIVHGNRHKKFLILCKTKDHVMNLEKLFKHYGMECATFFGNKKSYKDAKILIGSLGKISTGFDGATAAEEYDGVESDALILMATIKKEPLMKQTIGRVVGRAKNPSVIVLVDDNATQKRHVGGVKKMIEEVKGEIIIVDYNKDVAGGGIVLT